MATDVARISFDHGRKYTHTVPQQGRVSLEAEENEQHAMDDAERLADLLDIIGPVGTPDNGYAVSDAGGGDIDIGPGTMYAGGLRVTNDATIAYSAQPDWLDSDGDPVFIPVDPEVTGNQSVVLVLAEYDVTATEDPVLREVALGGPDGAARRRIVQRVRRLATTATDCAGAAVTDQQVWRSEGLNFDPATMRMTSDSSLQVVWTGPPPKADPCEPTATGGYLGAENQVIRVQVAASNANAGTFDLVWGWDNGSALYRVTPSQAGGGQFMLDRAPVDDYHNPRAGQPVEILRSAADLNSSDGVTEGRVAELTGQVSVLTAPYDPDTRSVVYPAALPAQYLDPAKTPQLYLRVWEELHAGVAPGDTVTLTGTGLSVQLTIPNGVAHPGDFWSIAVRPTTPDTVLPARFVREPQPPDGPRMWACPLAVIGWNTGAFTLLDDCRVPFPPLTGIQPGTGAGCCTVSVGPQDAGKLQRVIDEATAGRTPGAVSQRVTVCLKPGVYLLPEPLLLLAAQGNLHLEGCGDGAVLAAAPGKEAAFGQGLIIAVQADGVTISGLTFQMPLVPLRTTPAGGKFGSTARPTDTRITAIFRNLALSVGLRPIACQDLVVERCRFDFDAAAPPSPKAGGTTVAASETAAVMAREMNVLAFGIFAAGRCDRLSVLDCQFTSATAAQAAAFTAVRIKIGVLSSPAMVWSGTTGQVQAAASTAAFMLVSWLDDAAIRNNAFTGLTLGVGALGYLSGLRLEDNTLRDCYGGVWLAALDVLTHLDLVGTYQATGMTAQAMANVNTTVQAAMLDPVLMFLLGIAWSVPLPASASGVAAAEGIQPGGQTVTARRWTTRFVDQLATAPVVAGARAGAAAGQEELAEAPAQALFGGAAASQADLVAAGGTEAMVREAAFTVAEFARTFQTAVLQPIATIRIRGNEIDCAQPNLFQQTSGMSVASPTGMALLLWNVGGYSGTGEFRPPSAIIDANEFTAQSNGAVVTVFVVPVLTITGNLVRRADRKLFSLAIIGGGSQTAVTGNVMEGPALMPARAWAPPLDTWEPFNAMV